jgi:hypothetical protein
MNAILMAANSQAAAGVRALFELEPDLLDQISGGCDSVCQCPNPQLSQQCTLEGCGPVSVDC